MIINILGLLGVICGFIVIFLSMNIKDIYSLILGIFLVMTNLIILEKNKNA